MGPGNFNAHSIIHASVAITEEFCWIVFFTLITSVPVNTLAASIVAKFFNASTTIKTPIFFAKVYSLIILLTVSSGVSWSAGTRVLAEGGSYTSASILTPSIARIWKVKQLLLFRNGPKFRVILPVEFCMHPNPLAIAETVFAG